MILRGEGTEALGETDRATLPILNSTQPSLSLPRSQACVPTAVLKSEPVPFQRGHVTGATIFYWSNRPQFT